MVSGVITSDATEWGGPFTEGCSLALDWSVFHDPEGLSSLLGGHELMAGRLDSMFVAPNTFNYGTYGFVIHEIAEMVALNMGQYAHGNQPSNMPFTCTIMSVSLGKLSIILAML